MTEILRPTREEGKIYIDELGQIILRKPDTIRKWEKHPVHPLPKHLLPKKGKRGWRYWTPAQVYGKRGIIAWMKSHDMRPGRDVTAPEKEGEHIAHLRKPKYLTGDQLRGIRDMVKAGRSRRVIVNRYFKKTKYATPENLEKALVAYFAEQGWDFPPPPRKKKAKKVRVPKELKQLEAQADKLLASIDKK